MSQCRRPASTTRRPASGRAGSGRPRPRAVSAWASRARPYIRAKPLRTPKSSVGHTSSRPIWNIRNMCAVHSPMPRTSDELARRPCRRRGARPGRARPDPSSTFSARSRIDVALRSTARRRAASRTATRARRRESAARRTAPRTGRGSRPRPAPRAAGNRSCARARRSAAGAAAAVQLGNAVLAQHPRRGHRIAPRELARACLRLAAFVAMRRQSARRG